MRFTLSEEQALIQASALDWLAAHYDFEQRRRGAAQPGGSPEVWQAFAELGWLGLVLPESVGGAALGALEAGLLMQAFGRHRVVEPYHACVLQAGHLLARVGNVDQQQRWLPGLVAGTQRLALAHTETGDRLPWSARRCAAFHEPAGWRLNGRKRGVAGAPGAAAWLVSACEAGGQRELLLLVDASVAGATVAPYATTDGGWAADLQFDDVRLPADALLGEPGDPTTRALHTVLAEGLVWQAWEASGAMQALLTETAGYTAQRRQFGQALAGFQVVQHRLAEMAVHATEAQAACELATLQGIAEPGTAAQAAAAAVNKVGRAAREVAQQAVQLHGAMGVCEELPVAATFRQLLAFEHRSGGPAGHALRLGRQLHASGRYAHSQTLGVAA